jgi:2,4-dienoyl-CoA reductase-like NADH-dependent reductase (Old Yellow Enzyme family)
MFDKLFSPLDIGEVTIKNRIQITPHEQQYLENGLPSDTMIHYYIERAMGGAGLLEVSQLFIKEPSGVVSPSWKTDSARRFPFIPNPAIVPGLSRLAGSVHEYGAKIFMELSAWAHLYGPVSEIPFESGVSLNELTRSDIRQIQEDFVKGAKLITQGNFDGIDLHGTHGALIEHFYSPIMNRRNDEYGGSFENRMRFLYELTGVLRGEIGVSVALGMRLCADEKYPGGVTPDLAVKIAAALDGKLDFLNVDSGSVSQFEAMNQHSLQTQPLYVEPGYGIYMSEPIKKAVTKTRIGIAGRITDPVLAESIVDRNQADFVGMTRALIADPHLPNKAREGLLDDIRPCIGTLQDCWGRSVSHEWPMHCTVNPATGREQMRGLGKLEKASKQKKILIIGAGPAGLEAARVAAERGHQVTIYEKSGEIGGQVNLAKMLPGRADIGSIISWYGVQLRKMGVRIELHKEVPPDPSVIEFVIGEESPDTVVLATGSSPIVTGIQMITFSEISGWEGPNVRTIDQLLKSGEKLSGRVLVADSTTFIEGPGISEWLVRKGSSEVTLVTPHAHFSPELSDYNQLVHVARRLAASNVKILPFTWLRKISAGSVTLFDITTGKDRDVEADSVVLNTGRIQTNELRDAFKKTGVELFEVGDCLVAGGKIGGAIESGYRAAGTLGFSIKFRKSFPAV